MIYGLMFGYAVICCLVSSKWIEPDADLLFAVMIILGFLLALLMARG